MVGTEECENSIAKSVIVQVPQVRFFITYTALPEVHANYITSDRS
jgi:hypothetical protein